MRLLPSLLAPVALVALSSTVACSTGAGPTTSADHPVIEKPAPVSPPGSAEDESALDLPSPESFDSHESTAHFRVSYNRAESSAGEVAAVRDRLEPLFDGLVRWVGSERLPAAPIEVILEGDGMKEGEAPKFPRVGGLGRVHLFRFAGGESGAYERQLEHEVVHATRVMIGLHAAHAEDADQGSGFGFVEEGFAEMLAREIAPPQPGFPVFGQSLDVAAGAWLSAGESLPIPLLMTRHDLNLRCMAQAYPLRASFMKYLLETHGPGALLALAYAKEPMVPALYTKLFGAGPTELASAWERWATARFAAIPGSAEAAAAYRQGPIQFFPACRAGTDF